MNIFVCALFAVILLVEFVITTGGLSGYLVLLPELMTGIAVLVVVARLITGRSIDLKSKYIMILAALVLVMLVGIVTNSVETGTIVAGVRNYLKHLPIFLLPAVYKFSSRQLKIQFFVIAAILAIQAPVAIYQRFIEFASRMHTGDYIIGTVSTSGSLSMLVICAVAMIMSLYLRQKIGIVVMAVCTAVFLVPATINETKATLLLFPVVLLAPMFFMPNRRAVLRKFLPTVAMGSLAIVVFVGVYDYLATFSPYTLSTSEYLTNESATTFYLYTGASSIDQFGYIGRVDSLILAYQHSLQDPFTFIFGLGTGNVSDSIVAAFSGAYAVHGFRFGAEMTQIGHLLWEVGITGLILYLVLFFMVYRDAKWLANGTGFRAIVGQFWSTVMLVIVFLLVYMRFFQINELSYFFWFYSGLIASDRYRMSRSAEPEASLSASSPVGDADRFLGDAAPLYQESIASTSSRRDGEFSAEVRESLR